MRAGSQALSGHRDRIISIRIVNESDLVLARHRARQLAGLLGLTVPEQTAWATAVSEVGRNVLQYAGSGMMEFGLDLQARPQFLWLEASDDGPGIKDVEAVLSGRFSSRPDGGGGLVATRRLTDRLEIVSAPGKGTTVRLGKMLPSRTRPVSPNDLTQISTQLTQQPAASPLEELQRQNREIRDTLKALRDREAELNQRNVEFERLNLEMEETNRGVVALYAELEERAAELRRVNELKTQFLSHVSHEFRTPVNSIMALAHLLGRRTDGPLTPEQEKQVSFIRQAAEGLAEMVNDLLDLAKVESGKTEVRTGPVDVGQIFGAVRALMRPLATNDAVTLIFEEPSSRITLETDEAKLGQILRNLVSNALKFTERGEVRVMVRYIEESDLVCFSVSDTGIGISPEHQEEVFQEFSQVHHQMQKQFKGTGLGLSLSRKFAGLLGGSLELTSTLGAGSTFSLLLPSKPRVPEEELEPAAFSSDGRAPTILIVDDEETSRYLCRRMFPPAKYSIIESDGAEAAERARFDRPDLIFLDLMMPGRTGFEVLDELKSNPETASIPVIIHTSKTITKADLQRLAGRHLALLPKAGRGRRAAFDAIRQVLDDPRLFAGEPEFDSSTGREGTQ